MAQLEIEGKISRKLEVKTGRSQRGDWAKQEFVVDYEDGKFPAQAVFNVWGQDRVEELRKFNVGDQVKVSFSVSSREFNGRWYTDLRAYRIAPAAQQAAAPQAPSRQSVPEPPANEAPAPTMEDMPSVSSDDMPF